MELNVTGSNLTWSAEVTRGLRLVWRLVLRLVLLRLVLRLAVVGRGGVVEVGKDPGCCGRVMTQASGLTRAGRQTTWKKKKLKEQPAQ